MKLYRVFGGLHYRGSLFPPFIETQWTIKKAEAVKAYEAVTIADFKKNDNGELEQAKQNDYFSEPKERLFLWIELVTVNINRKKFPPNDKILEIANYTERVINDRGLHLNGRNMKDKTLESITIPDNFRHSFRITK